ncbi:MAG: phage baseplate assembly protein V [Ilumatobacteraceae bacterium]
MVTGYGGTYRGTVVDDADPMQQYCLLVLVPDVYGDTPIWAVALMSGAQLPAIGDLVSVSFEHGDSDYPIWEPDTGGRPDGHATGGYVGRYRGIVLSNDDPVQENRLEVMVPDVDPGAA